MKLKNMSFQFMNIYVLIKSLGGQKKNKKKNLKCFMKLDLNKKLNLLGKPQKSSFLMDSSLRGGRGCSLRKNELFSH